LNSDKNSPLSKRRPFSEGEYGRAYLLKSTKGEVVVKSISLSLNIDFKKRREMLAQMLKEYSIAKICEALGCGPTLPRAFGFDLLIFRNSIEFAMEKCSPLTVFSDEDEEKLSEELGIMHRHNLVHMDIKPFNIMRSTRGHLVFIDFGFSDAITEDCGYKTLTTYRGTPQFVSKDMLKLILVDVIEGYVDLYHNDLTCLTNSINKIRLEVPSTEDKLSESYLPTDLLKSQ
jgi:serine/threonine protein kinase